MTTATSEREDERTLSRTHPPAILHEVSIPSVSFMSARMFPVTGERQFILDYNSSFFLPAKCSDPRLERQNDMIVPHNNWVPELLVPQRDLCEG